MVKWEWEWEWESESENQRSSREGRVPPPTGSTRAGAAQEVEFGRIVEAGEVVALVQAEDLPLGKVRQVGEDGHRLLPVVADPGKGKQGQSLVLAAQSL